jgi:hypothetical protein
MNKCHTDHSVFYIHSGSMYVLLVIYVDDIIVTDNDNWGIKNVKCFLSTKFHIRDIGTLKYFLGIEVAHSADNISLFQRKYPLDLLKDSMLLGSKPTSTPTDPNQKLTNNHGELLDDPGSYRRLVLKLNYLTITLQPDIFFCSMCSKSIS